MNNQRISLLTRAVELSSSLISVLQEIGPPRCVAKVVDDASPGQVHVLEDALSALLRIIARLQNATLPSISRLTNELLSQIFSLTALHDGPPCLSCLTVVTRVSSHWRNVAFRTPALWTDIVLGEGDSCRDAVVCSGPPEETETEETEYEDTRLQRNKEWLHRSRAVPVTLDIRSEIDDDEASDILDMIYERMEFGFLTIGQIYCTVASPVAVVFLLRAIPLCLRTLKKLHVEVDKEFAKDPGAALERLNQVFRVPMVALKDVQFSGPLPPDFRGVRCTRLSLITDVESTRLHLRNILQSCLTLEHLHINRHNAVPIGGPSARPLTMQNLRVLSLEDDDPSDMFALIMAPSLQTLSLDTLKNASDTLNEFLPRSSPRVTSIDFPSLAPAALPAVLQHIPELAFIGFGDPDDSLQGLTALNNALRHDPACRYPTLRSVRFRFSGTSLSSKPAWLSQVRAFLLRKRLRNAAIRVLELEMPNTEWSDDVEDLATDVESLIFNGRERIRDKQEPVEEVETTWDAT